MRFALLLCLSFGIVPLVSAQVLVAPKAGLNVSTWSGSDSNDPDVKLGFVGGVSLQVPMEPVSVVVEALYSQKGIERGGQTLAFDYAELALLGRLAIPTNSALEVGVGIGPWVGIPVSTDLDALTDFGLALGLDVGSGPFYVEARYDLGLTDIPDTVADLDIQNQSVALTGGYRIVFGG
ncbi:MAG: hypothetical protein AAGI52_01125 [Bacteroidota bacterium]